MTALLGTADTQAEAAEQKQCLSQRAGHDKSEPTLVLSSRCSAPGEGCVSGELGFGSVLRLRSAAGVSSPLRLLLASSLSGDGSGGSFGPTNGFAGGLCAAAGAGGEAAAEGCAGPAEAAEDSE